MNRKQQKHKQIKTSFALSRRSHMMGLPTKTKQNIFFTEAYGLNRISDNFIFFLIFDIKDMMI